MNSFTLRKRLFLAPVSTGFTSYVFAEVESSQGGRYKCGHYMLSIADCRRRIEVEFFLGTPHARQQSLAKLDRLVEVITAFRLALRKEARLITECEREGKRAQINSVTRRKLNAKLSGS